jgi:hypothetical protein
MYKTLSLLQNQDFYKKSFYLKEIKQLNQYMDLLSFMVFGQYEKIINCKEIFYLSRVWKMLGICAAKTWHMMMQKVLWC